MNDEFAINDEPVASPCINVCSVDAGGRYCLGCYRTLAEIAAWSELGAEQRRAVLAAAERRMAALFDD